MADDTTTISISDWQKEWLDDFKEPGQSYKGALESLIEVYGQHEHQAIDSHNSGSQQMDEDELAKQLGRKLGQQLTDDLVSQLPPKIAEELQ